jgi:hypothetical protein
VAVGDGPFDLAIELLRRRDARTPYKIRAGHSARVGPAQLREWMKKPSSCGRLEKLEQKHGVATSRARLATLRKSHAHNCHRAGGLNPLDTAENEDAALLERSPS